jgi:hypothetical protein
MAMKSLPVRDDCSGAPRRSALILLLAVVGVLTFAGCASTAPIEEAPAPSPFAEHGQ